MHDPQVDRSDFLTKTAAHSRALHACISPSLAHSPAHLREHDELDELLAGIELVLAGVTASLA